MIDQLIAELISAILRAVKAFFNVPQNTNNKDHTSAVDKDAALDPNDDINEALSSALFLTDMEELRYITPFNDHILKYFQSTEPLTRSEVVENFLLALGNTAEEIESLAPGQIVCSIEQEESSNYLILHGHLKWDIDNLNPRVYAIAIELLKDGFTFMADSKTFVITSRVKK